MSDFRSFTVFDNSTSSTVLNRLEPMYLKVWKYNNYSRPLVKSEVNNG